MENQDGQRAAPEYQTSDSRDDAIVDAYILEAQVGHLFRRGHQQAKAMFAERIGEPKLTPRQFAALVKIREHDKVSQNLLGRMTAMDPATVQGVVRRLSDKSLVTREDDPDDQRRTLLRLTPAGRRVIEDAIQRVGVMTHDLLKPLSAQEREVFLAMLRRVVVSSEERRPRN
ncbi:MAG: MarR family transcriptional regulator [Alphaproteobacteria bacterium]|nr:MarR family transcriptional regulator [Alphaproteobacteria bacterium]